jgi:ubiquinol-cytochrome c reductase subunit 6
MEECNIAAQIRVKCEPGCVGFKKALDACAARVETLKEKHPDANCELQYFDYQACLDKCVAPKLFQKLK